MRIDTPDIWNIPECSQVSTQIDKVHKSQNYPDEEKGPPQRTYLRQPGMNKH